MKVLVVSGFLGAGKTTFIKELVKRTSFAELVILENEYGQVGLDGEALREQKLDVWELAEGCICCSMKGNFAASVLTIANTLAPEFLIVEPSGVGLLSSITANLKKIAYSQIQLLAPVALVDAPAWRGLMDEYGQYVTDQVQTAASILITKTDRAEGRDMESLKKWLAQLNPSAEVIDDYRAQPSSWWGGLLHRPLGQVEIPLPPAGVPALESVAFLGLEADAIEKVMGWVESLLSGQCGRVVRAKGVLTVQGQPTRFEVAGGTFSIETCEAAPEPRAVVIGTNLNRQSLEKIFAPAVVAVHGS
ncbi:CobW family GTP-binding protein [Jonquetella sp. BV3C21]|uniref:CobW family GTP-binding protein n=2 Tax=Jonquetella TaxID=428711 RepID=UPI0003AE6C98|nr:GTP-binding protein [Jonquetella sp. BV3C21]ERL24466.1 CobW/P47K family protein [Jonquetella sp. BV3C21]